MARLRRARLEKRSDLRVRPFFRLVIGNSLSTAGKSVPQSRLILSGKGANGNGDYWRHKPDRNVFDPANSRLCFVRNVAPERTVGNRLRRPLTYALKVADIPLSCISVPATLIRELYAPSIFIQSAPTPPAEGR